MQLDFTAKNPPRFFALDGYVFQTLRDRDGELAYLRKGTLSKFGVTAHDSEQVIEKRVRAVSKQAATEQA